MLYHLCTAEEWEVAKEVGHHSPPSLAAEGFVHASTAAQVVPTANRYYRKHERIVLLSIAERAVSSALRWEPPSPETEETRGQLFPHIYASLPREAILAARVWERGPEGLFVWEDETEEA